MISNEGMPSTQVLKSIKLKPVKIWILRKEVNSNGFTVRYSLDSSDSKYSQGITYMIDIMDISENTHIINNSNSNVENTKGDLESFETKQIFYTFRKNLDLNDFFKYKVSIIAIHESEGIHPSVQSTKIFENEPNQLAKISDLQLDIH
jgi:hypothetical protein